MDELLTLRAVPTVDDLTTRAAPVGELTTLDEKTRSIEYTLLTETRAIVYAPEIGEIVDEVVLVEGVEWPTSIRLLADHDKYDIDKVRGSVRDFRRESAMIVGRAYFAEDDQSERAWIKVKGGHLPNISAGYRATEATYIQPGETTTVSGRSFTANSRILKITTRATMRESSLVAVGADAFATARNALPQSTTNRGDAAPKDSPMKFTAWLKLKGKNPEALSDTERAALKTEFLTERRSAGDTSADGEGETNTERAARNPSAPQVDQAAIDRAARTAAESALTTERARIAAIEDMAGGDEHLAETCRLAIREGWDTARASAEFLKKTREARSAPGGAPAIHIASEATTEALGAMLTMRAGVDLVARATTDDRKKAAEKLSDLGDRHRDMSLFDVCRAAIRLDGGTIPGSRDDTIRSAVSGGTLVNIFTQSISAILLGSFNEVGDSTQGLCSEVDVPNFKSNDRIRAGEVGNLKRLPRGGKAKHADMSDSNESYKISRFAEQMVIDEQDIIDDNFGILQQQGEQFGAAARRLRPDLVYAILMSNPALGIDSTALFHVDHANIGTGAGSVLSEAALTAAITAIAKQKGVRAEVILNLMAKTLVVPPDLKFTAAKLLKSTEVREGRGGSGAGNQPTYNALQDEGLTLRTEQRLVSGFNDPITGAAITGAATKWFLFGDPKSCPTIEVGYLRGTGRAPVIRSFTLDRGQWGVGFDVKYDIGAKALDYRNMYYAAGA